MMTSYDDAFAAALDPQSPQASETGSRYDDAFSALGEAADSAVRTSLYRAQDGNPDQAAKVQALARRTGLHPDTVETAFPDIERQVRLADQQQVLESSPALKSWLADAANAKVAHDDFDRLSLVERTVSAAKTGWHEAVAGNERGRLAYRGIGGQLAPADDSRIKELDGELSAKFGGDGNPFFHTVRTVSGLLGGLWDMAERAAPTAAAGTAVGGAWGVAGGPLAPATVPAGMALGASAGFGAGMFADAFQVSAGNLYHGLGTARDAEGRPVDDRVREGASLFGGLVVGALQTWGIRVGTKPYAEAGQRLVENAVREAVARPGTALAMASFGREVAKGSGEGAILGAATEAANVVAEQVARLASDGDFRTMLDDPAQRGQALDRILAGASDMAVGMGVLRMPPAGVNLGADLLRARRATSDHAFLSDLASGAAESRTRERVPRLKSDIMLRKTFFG